MMASLAVAAIPASILNAALPIAARRDTDPFTDALRLGLALTTPIIAMALAAPGQILGLVNPDLAGGSRAFTILLLTVTPFTVLAAATIKLNKEARKRELTLIGALRLASLLALIHPLTNQYSAEGAALATC